MHDAIYREFGERLAEIRKRQGLTQTDVAVKLGTTQSTYSGYELGTRKVTLDLIRQFSAIFNVSPNYLTGVETQYIPNKTILHDKEYPTMARYRALSSRGKEVVDRLLDKLYAEEKENAPTAYSDERIETILQNRPDLTELANQIRMMDGEQTLKAIDYIQYLLSQQDKT